MWIVKIGGSLNTDPHLPEWLNVLTQLGGGRVVLVCGGGRFADAVREHQSHWKFNDLAAHNMALLAMVQTAHFLHALSPGLQMVSTDADAMRVLRLGKTPLWSPLALLAEQPDADTNWQVTSDSLALALAMRLGAEQLLVVKSCAIDPALSFDQMGEAGIVDQRFATLAEQCTVDIRFLQRDQPQQMRELLLAAPELASANP